MSTNEWDGYGVLSVLWASKFLAFNNLVIFCRQIVKEDRALCIQTLIQVFRVVKYFSAESWITSLSFETMISMPSIYNYLFLEMLCLQDQS